MELNELRLTDKRKLICQKLDLNNSDDILRYYPYKYENYSITHYKDFKVNERVFFEGELLNRPTTFNFRRNLSKTTFKVLYEEEEIIVTIFNRPWFKGNNAGDKIIVLGKYEDNNKVTALNVYTKDINSLIGIQPIYSLKEGIKHNEIIKLIEYTFNKCENEIIDDVPESLIKSHGLIDLKTALKNIHKPYNDEMLKKALARLKYDEFLKFYLGLETLKRNIINDQKNIKEFDLNIINNFIDDLPFSLTIDQINCLNDIFNDLRNIKPMYRLVQGEVGSGKTIIALIALYANYLAGYQGALMAPTEILAKQHYETFCDLLINKLNIALLYSGGKNNDEIKEKIKEGKVDIVIGTHSLFQDDVIYNNLGLVIADEQHRFGVKQRRALKEKGQNVDFMIMSATPIPRTLASSIYGDLDISTIASMPLNRKGCDTYLIKKNSIVDILTQIKEKLQEGRQIYIIAPSIENNENFVGKDVTTLYNSLIDVFLPYKIGLIHGRLKTNEKDEIMFKFKNNEIQVLLSTTVIEVGVNVKNATVMIIYNAERFGLSQIHQLRGRVQRGDNKGTCYLLTDNNDPNVLNRLNVLCKYNDGFKISEEDLRIRGPGDILGTRQSGLPMFVLGNIFEDHKIIDGAKKDIQIIVNNLDNPEYKKFYDRIIKISQSKVVD